MAHCLIVDASNRRAIARVLLLAFVGVLALGGTPAAAADPIECRPFGKSVGKQMVAETAVVKDAPRRTQYGPDGYYVTTVCDSDGEPTLQVGMMPVRTPDGEDVWLPVSRRTPGKYVAVTRTRSMTSYKGDWSAAVTEARNYGLQAIDREKVTAPQSPSAAAAARRQKARARAATTGGPWKCSDTTFTYTGMRWYSGYGYYSNFTAFGGYASAFLGEAINGAHTWQFRYNTCGLTTSPVGRPETVPTAHLGTTSGSFNATSDGVNVVDAGSMPAGACTGGIGCTYAWPTYSGSGIIYEADIRISNTETWTIGASPGALDIWALFAHEFGHAIGFDHSPWNDTKVMYPGQEANDISQRYMGAGDYLAEHYIYG